MAKKRKARSNGFARYDSYNFIDKDPILDLTRVARRDSPTTLTDAGIARESGVSTTTLRNWRPNGKTKRPQFATMAAVWVVLGQESIPITAEARRRFRGS